MRFKKLFLGEEGRGRLQLDELDGIRGLAVLFVLFSHLANEDLVLLPFKLAGDASGKIGVFLFFTLSSFLLSRALLVKLNAASLTRSAWLTYSVRRIMRIYPFYIVALVFVMVAHSAELDVFLPMYWRDVWTHLLLMDGKEHFWTIATEVKFYLILPLLILAYQWIGLGRQLKYIAFLLLVAVFAQFIPYVFELNVRHSLIRYLPIFTVGTIGALVYSEMRLDATLLGRRIAQWISYLCLFALFVMMPNVMGLLSERFLGQRIAFMFPIGLFWGVLCTTLVVATLIAPENFLKRIYRSTPMRIFGAMSFSLYINHWFVLQFVLQLQLSVLSQIILFWVITFVVSSITYLLVERPLSRLRLEKGFQLVRSTTA